MMKRLLVVLGSLSTLQAMVFDNRFLPLYLKPFVRRCDALSHLRVQPFFMHADRAFAEDGEMPIPNINGFYDQQVLARALVDAGFSESLRSDFRLRTSIPWNRRGRLDAQGIALLYEQSVAPWCSLGVNVAFAHVAMRHRFTLSDEQIAEGDKEYLLQAKDAMHKEIGLRPALFSKTLFGDIDLYLRFGGIWDYTLRFRRIDASVKFGVYIPSASERDLANPASFSLGDNKHWGLYGGFESEWELREDLSVGLMFRAIKRLEKTQTLRLPVLTEPQEYGVLCGPVSVAPGWTFVFNPTVDTAHLRRGFGLRAGYSLVAHLEDSYSDRRPVEVQNKFPLKLPQSFSSWGAEYISIGAYYDFAKVHDCPSLYPKISLYWDIPVNWLVSKRAAKTTSVSLMFELDF
jgi:hypothetical protein